jgi:hypothetical protein
MSPMRAEMVRTVVGSLLATFSSRGDKAEPVEQPRRCRAMSTPWGAPPRRHQTADASHSLSFDHLRLVCLPFTAIGIAFFCRR